MQPAPRNDGAFGHPSGLAGRVAGWLMASLNDRMNRAAVELLEVSPEARVLELGFGPGTALAALLARAPKGFVAGVDPSASMHAQAAARNRDAIDSGRLSLHLGTAERLPFPGGHFSHALSVNSFQIWPDPGAALRELDRVLTPGARLLVVLRVRSASGRRLFDRIALDEAALTRARAQIEAAGFADVEMLVRGAGLMTAACLRARRRG